MAVTIYNCGLYSYGRFNLDHPDSGDGDDETPEKVRQQGELCGGSEPLGDLVTEVD